MPAPISPEGYTATGGSICPACGSTALYPSSLKRHSISTVTQVAACGHCWATWTAVYELTGYEGLTTPTREEEPT